ncbi:MAG: hypothetical protein SGJ05_11100 [bacterium]|nr:hypothetical protein [bacterium]
MNPSAAHIASHFRLRLPVWCLVLVCMLFVGTTTAFADKSKKVVTTKPATAKERRAAEVIKYGTPYTGAVEATLAAVARGSKAATSAGKTLRTQNGADSSRKESRIVYVRATSDIFSARIDLYDDEQTIDVGIYNMLGKKVHDVYRGYASRGQHDYSVPINDLPEGVYICIAQGSAFRGAQKFFLSR